MSDPDRPFQNQTRKLRTSNRPTQPTSDRPALRVSLTASRVPSRQRDFWGCDLWNGPKLHPAAMMQKSKSMVSSAKTRRLIPRSLLEAMEPLGTLGGLSPDVKARGLKGAKQAFGTASFVVVDGLKVRRWILSWFEGVQLRAWSCPRLPV